MNIHLFMIQFNSGKLRSTNAPIAGQIYVKFNIKEIPGNMSDLNSIAFPIVSGSLTLSK